MKRSAWLLLVILTLLVTALGVAWSAEAVAPQAVLLAGAGRGDITPDLPGPAGQKVCLGGYGARNAKPAEGVRDHVFARALVLSDGNQKVCFVALDALQPPAALKADLLAALKDLGYQAKGFIVGASHSHSAPDNHTDQGPLIAAAFGARSQHVYDAFLKGALAAVKQADASLRPAVVGAGKVEVALNRNRRPEEGSTLTDPALTVLRVDGTDGKPIATLFNYTAHPTIMDADNMLISAEWPGQAETALEAALPGSVALFFNGAEGDQSPDTEGMGSGYEAVKAFGAAIAKQALALRESIKPAAPVRLAAAVAELKMPAMRVSPAFMETIAKEYSIPEAVANSALKAMAPPSVEQSAIAVGDAVFVSVPGEMVTEPLGLNAKRIEAEAGFKFPVLIGLSPQDVSYIVDDKGYAKGGYETAMSFYGPTIGQTVLDGIARLVAEVKPK